MVAGYQERLFERILHSVNHDVRATMLLKGISRDHESATQIRKILLESIQGEPFVERAEDLLPKDPSFRDYCKLLESNGFAERLVEPNELSRSGEVSRWAITPDADKYVVPAAAYSIRAASSFDVSIFRVLGKTGAPPESTSRASYNTAMILLKLYDKRELTESQLAKILQLYSSDLRDHCVKLSHFGFVKREVGRIASDRLTPLGEGLVEEFLLPVWFACDDLSYAEGEYRNVLNEYLEDQSRMRHDIVSALFLLSKSR